MSPVSLHSTDWQAGFLALLPAVQTYARIRFRKLPAEKREESIQEALAAACLQYQLAAVQGKLHAVRPGALAGFAIRHVKTGRHVGGSQDAVNDLLSPACQRRHGVQVRSYSDGPAESGDGWMQMAIANHQASVADTAAFRVDFGQWLRTLTRRDRRIIAALIAGHGTSAVANRFGLSPGRVSQLRRRYERLWCRFQGQPLSRAA